MPTEPSGIIVTGAESSPVHTGKGGTLLSSVPCCIPALHNLVHQSGMAAPLLDVAAHRRQSAQSCGQQNVSSVVSARWHGVGTGKRSGGIEAHRGSGAYQHYNFFKVSNWGKQ